jgi:hypothetical protein
MLRRVVHLRTDISEEASFIRVTRIGELGTTLAVTSNRRTLRRNLPNLNHWIEVSSFLMNPTGCLPPFTWGRK